MTLSTQCTPTSELIRIAACDLFCRDGYKGVGMRNLAAAVGIHPGSLYAHIESKQALLNELISGYELNLLQLFKSRGVCRATTALQATTRLWDEVETYVSHNRNLAALSCAEHRHLTLFQLEKILAIRRRRVHELAALFSRFGDVGLGEAGMQKMAVELCALIECNTNLIVDARTPGNEVLRTKLREMARLLLIKRD